MADKNFDKNERALFDPGESKDKPLKPLKIINDKEFISEDNIEDKMGVFDDEVIQGGISEEEAESLEEDETIRGVVLLSGGLDSVAALGWAIDNDVEVRALIVNYGASNSKEEIKAAKKVAKHYGVPYDVLKINVPFWNKGLTSENPDIFYDTKVTEEKIAGEYVPARNTLFLSYAYAYAESFDLDAIIVGFNKGMDENPENVSFGYMPDTSPVFCRAFQYVINTSTSRQKYTIALLAPFLRSSKADIIRYANQSDVPLHYSYSCFNGEKEACGKCRACVARLRAYDEVGIEDKIIYQDKEFYKKEAE